MTNFAAAKVAQVTGINLKATGTTDIIAAQSGKKVVVLKCKVVVATLTGAGASPTVSLGSNASTYDNVLYDQLVQTYGAGYVADIPPTTSATNFQAVGDIGSTALKFNVKIAAGAGVSAMTADVYVEYILIPF